MGAKPTGYRGGAGTGLGLVVGAALGLLFAQLGDWNLALAVGIGVAAGLVAGAVFDLQRAAR